MLVEEGREIDAMYSDGLADGLGVAVAECRLFDIVVQMGVTYCRLVVRSLKLQIPYHIGSAISQYPVLKT